MKFKVEPITVVAIFALFFYAASVADRAVEGKSLENLTKEKVISVVKEDAKKVKEELKKIEPSKELKVNI